MSPGGRLESGNISPGSHAPHWLRTFKLPWKWTEWTSALSEETLRRESSKLAWGSWNFLPGLWLKSEVGWGNVLWAPINHQWPFLPFVFVPMQEMQCGGVVKPMGLYQRIWIWLLVPLRYMFLSKFLNLPKPWFSLLWNGLLESFLSWCEDGLYYPGRALKPSGLHSQGLRITENDLIRQLFMQAFESKSWISSDWFVSRGRD